MTRATGRRAGGVSVLFQFVVPPPVSVVTPLQQMDFRPRLLEEDDPTFLGCRGRWALCGRMMCPIGFAPCR